MMTKTKFDETYIFKISIKIRFFYISFSIEIPFFRVSFTIEPGRSLLQFVTTNCLIPLTKIEQEYEKTKITVIVKELKGVWRLVSWGKNLIGKYEFLQLEGLKFF